MAGMKFRAAYEFDPETYGGQGAGLVGRLQAMMRQGQAPPGADAGSPSNGVNTIPTTMAVRKMDDATSVLFQGSGAGDGLQMCRLMLAAEAFRMCLYRCPNGEIRRLPIDNRNLGCPPLILGSHGFGVGQ